MFVTVIAETLADDGGPLKDEEAVETAAFKCLGNTDYALRYMTYLIFDQLVMLILSYNLYLKRGKWSELLQ